MDQKNQPPLSPPAPPPPPPPDQATVEINLTPETPPFQLPPPPAEPDTTEAEKAKRKKLIEQAQGYLASAYDALAELGGPQPSMQDAMAKAIAEALVRAGEHDALLSYDIRFSNREGEIFQLSGHNIMHQFSSDDMLSEGPRNFEALLYTSLFRPMKSQIQSYINTFVKNDNTIFGDPTLGINDHRPEIPEARPGSYITTG